jgi:hypothetical protein
VPIQEQSEDFSDSSDLSEDTPKAQIDVDDLREQPAYLKEEE